MKVTQLSQVSFQSKLPQKQQKEIQAPKYWKSWGQDYWEEFTLNCQNAGKEKELFECLDRLSKNGDDGILVLNKDCSNWDVGNYHIGLYHNQEDVEKDRNKPDDTGVRLSNTKNKQSICLRDYDMDARLEITGCQSDEKIDLKGITGITAALLFILKKITTPGSKEFKHLGFDTTPKIIKDLNKFRIK